MLTGMEGGSDYLFEKPSNVFAAPKLYLERIYLHGMNTRLELDIYKLPWKQDRKGCRSIIGHIKDYIIMKPKSQLKVEDTRVLRDIECRSDHFFGNPWNILAVMKL